MIKRPDCALVGRRNNRANSIRTRWRLNQSRTLENAYVVRRWQKLDQTMLIVLQQSEESVQWVTW